MKVNVNKLPLLDLWQDEERSKSWKANLPFTPQFPLWSGIQTKESSVVYFELEPGKELGEHAESSEEVLFVVTGTVEVYIEDKFYQATDGELFVIPGNTKHGVINKGDTTARFVGFFASADSRSTFTEEVSPLGMKVL